jgi:2-succinyl-5-enolpyruvyl-6-hydroxy-3-cyclohexene-1-carboxylate synthase
MNNNGGGIFCMLPQCSSDPYFDRLFITPHDVDFALVAKGFGADLVTAGGIEEFAEHYRAAQNRPGVHIIEVRTDMAQLKERFLSRR